MNSLRKITAFFKKSLIVQMNYTLDFFISIFNTVFVIAVFFFLIRLFNQNLYLEKYKGDLFTFLLIGLAYARFLDTWLNCFSNSLQSEFFCGALEMILVTPIKIFEILFFSTLWPQVYALFHVLIYFTVGITFFQAHISASGYLLASLIALVSMIIFMGFGIISAAILLIFKRGLPLRSVLYASSLFLGGAYFPVEVLPQAFQKISYILPVTYSLRAIRNVLINGYTINLVYDDVKILFIFAIILFPASLYIFKRAFRHAKSVGSLAHY
ncbi:MAG: hypothetical protein A2984_00540 [Omnitrophica WOR_2 bacterium RIFCSPLOWO2_01_FULL_41_12]|nr:MAG: hypothetical protein A2984_00540 [Omnitrophica WOR_2 bacterium RIFCSPLOWO2_01_FULL_41_12]